MITILNVENTVSRTFGWVQDPSNFRSLCDVVAVFDNQSAKHRELLNTTLPRLVLESEGQSDLIGAISSVPLRISYSHLVGTSFKPRSAARCNGIVQAAVKGQRRDFISDWPADNFVRWAYCLGFIKYDYADDTFEITQSGLSLSGVSGEGDELNNEERSILTDAMLSYPPVIRVLSLLEEENTHLTKFEIGRQLGFTGEGGFTSMPQSVLIRSLSAIADTRERNEMRNNWEGSSDKYARMIASWLIKLGLVSKVAKDVTVSLATETYTETIGQSYMITAQGLTALRRARGVSRHSRIPKTLCYEMLATSGATGSDKEFLRTRRGLITKILSESRGSVTTDEISDFLSGHDILVSRDVIADDIQGLMNIGLDIEINGNTFTWRDKINDFIIPIRAEIEPSDREQIKDELRANITHIPHEYLSLVDLAHDGLQNRLFEMKTLQLLTEECRFDGLHLGGSRKPDGVVYTTQLADNYGIIIDTKAYSRGYGLSIGQADEMQRYVAENQRRDESENPNKWWEHFGNDVSRFYFMFVSGKFTGRCQEQIDRISRITDTTGTAMEIYDLLLIAESIKDGTYSLASVEDELFEL